MHNKPNLLVLDESFVVRVHLWSQYLEDCQKLPKRSNFAQNCANGHQSVCERHKKSSFFAWIRGSNGKTKPIASHREIATSASGGLAMTTNALLLCGSMP